MSPDRPDQERPREHQLLVWARAYVDPAAEVAGVVRMPGHAGSSLGFDVLVDGEVARSLVVRFAPPGVRRRGNTDVLRQVPLLQALAAEGVPVAPLVWHTGDPAWFGTDCIVQERLAAGPLDMFDASTGVRPVDGTTTPYLRSAVEALAQVHRVDWRTHLADWQEPRHPEAEVAFWRGLLDKAPEQEWINQGAALAERIVATDPGCHEVGVFHGDYQTHNILFDPDDGALEAVIDWEIAGLGATGLDVGWLAMMADPACWPPALSERLRVRAEPDDVFTWYADAAGAEVPHQDWYTALACFRYGAISAFNVRLHRTGKQVDPFNEQMADGVPVLFDHGWRLLQR